MWIWQFFLLLRLFVVCEIVLVQYYSLGVSTYCNHYDFSDEPGFSVVYQFNIVKSNKTLFLALV